MSEGLGLDPEKLKDFVESFRQATHTNKMAPTSSQVHVPSAGEEQKLKKEHDKVNLERLQQDVQDLATRLSAFFSEEKTEKKAKRRVATVAVMHKNHLLMGKRRDNGKWTVPGGHLEEHEDFKQGAIRELYEEAGIDKPQHIDAIGEIHKVSDDLHVQPFGLKLRKRVPTSMLKDPDGEIERWKWIDTSKGLPEEIKNNLHVPFEKNCLMKAIGLRKDDQAPNDLKPQVPLAPPIPPADPNDPLDPDESAQVNTRLNNMETQMLKACGFITKDQDTTTTNRDNDIAGLTDMQELVSGMDYEMDQNPIQEEQAHLMAIDNLNQDPDFYKKKWAQADNTDDALNMSPALKDTQEGEEDPFAGEGLNLDLGSGSFREPNHIGIDTYPYDYGTVVHDLSLGIPVPDASVKKVRVTNSLEEMENPKELLSEIHRVLMPGGQFLYEGPNEIYNYPEWTQDYPGFVLVNHEDNAINKDVGDGDSGNVVRQVFERTATPDPATSNTAEPRIGVTAQDALPEDALLAMDAMSYYYSDATSSGRGNRLNGYPSQGALVGKDWEDEDDFDDEDDEDEIDGRRTKSGDIHKKVLKSSMVRPILKADIEKQIVYGVILAPDEVDSQDDWMPADEIEKTAHAYLAKSRVVGAQHEEQMQAVPVESYIAPQDLQWDGQYGPQTVKKGSWVMAVKVLDPDHWQKVKSGEYTGFSIGGMGVRE